MSSEGKIPAWMADKLTRLARERAERDRTNVAEALPQLEGEAFQALTAELIAFPELARLLFPGFARNVRTGAFSALSVLELAAITIADSDAQDAAQCAGPDDLEEFVALKWQALAGILRAEGGKAC